MSKTRKQWLSSGTILFLAFADRIVDWICRLAGAHADLPDAIKDLQRWLNDMAGGVTFEMIRLGVAGAFVSAVWLVPVYLERRKRVDALEEGTECVEPQDDAVDPQSIATLQIRYDPKRHLWCDANGDCEARIEIANTSAVKEVRQVRLKITNVVCKTRKMTPDPNTNRFFGKTLGVEGHDRGFSLHPEGSATSMVMRSKKDSRYSIMVYGEDDEVSSHVVPRAKYEIEIELTGKYAKADRRRFVVSPRRNGEILFKMVE